MAREVGGTLPEVREGREAARSDVSGSAVILLCRVVDHLLPDLKDTELRLLLVVLRQTLLRGKHFDWLASRQLKERTGRASEAVSAAVDALVNRGLLEVRNGGGRLLTTTHERRREHGRLYFGLGPVLLSAASDGSLAGMAREVFDFPKTTRTTYIENCRLRKPNTGDSSSPVATVLELSERQRIRIEQEKERIRLRLGALRERPGAK